MNRGIVYSFIFSVFVHTLFISVPTLLSFFLGASSFAIVEEETELTQELEENNEKENELNQELDLTNINVDVVPISELETSFEDELLQKMKLREEEIRKEIEEKFKKELEALKKEYEEKLKKQDKIEAELEKKNKELNKKLKELEKAKNTSVSDYEKKLKEFSEKRDAELKKLEEEKKKLEEERNRIAKENAELKEVNAKLQKEKDDKIAIAANKEKTSEEVKKVVSDRNNFINIYPLRKHAGTIVNNLDFSKPFEIGISMAVESNGEFTNLKLDKTTGIDAVDNSFKNILLEMGAQKNAFIGDNFKYLSINIFSDGLKLTLTIKATCRNILTTLVSYAGVLAAIDLAKDLNKNNEETMTFLNNMSADNKSGVIVITIKDVDPMFVKEAIQN